MGPRGEEGFLPYIKVPTLPTLLLQRGKRRQDWIPEGRLVISLMGHGRYRGQDTVVYLATYVDILDSDFAQMWA